QWHAFAEAMVAQTAAWLALEQDVAHFMRKQYQFYQGGFHQVVPAWIVDDAAALDKRRVDLLTTDKILLNESKTVKVPDLKNQFPVIPLKWDEATQGKKPSNVYTIKESREYWAKRLVEIDRGLEYLKGVIKVGNITDQTVSLIYDLYRSLQAETEYYWKHAKNEIDMDEAYQLSNGTSETEAEALARKQAARQAQLKYLRDGTIVYEDAHNPVHVPGRISILQSLLDLGVNWLKDQDPEAQRLNTEREKAIWNDAIDIVSRWYGMGANNPLYGIQNNAGALTRIQETKIDEQEVILEAKRAAEAKEAEFKAQLMKVYEKTQEYQKALLAVWEESISKLEGSSHAEFADYNRMVLDGYFTGLMRSVPSTLAVGDKLYEVTKEDGSAAEVVDMILVNGTSFKEFAEAEILRLKSGDEYKLATNQYFAYRDFLGGADLFITSNNPAAGLSQQSVIIGVDMMGGENNNIVNSLQIGAQSIYQNKQIPVTPLQLDENGDLKMNNEGERQTAWLLINSLGAKIKSGTAINAEAVIKAMSESSSDEAAKIQKIIEDIYKAQEDKDIFNSPAKFRARLAQEGISGKGIEEALKAGETLRKTTYIGGTLVAKVNQNSGDHLVGGHTMVEQDLNKAQTFHVLIEATYFQNTGETKFELVDVLTDMSTLYDNVGFSNTYSTQKIGVEWNPAIKAIEAIRLAVNHESTTDIFQGRKESYFVSLATDVKIARFKATGEISNDDRYGVRAGFDLNKAGTINLSGFYSKVHESNNAGVDLRLQGKSGFLSLKAGYNSRTQDPEMAITAAKDLGNGIRFSAGATTVENANGKSQFSVALEKVIATFGGNRTIEFAEALNSGSLYEMSRLDADVIAKTQQEAIKKGETVEILEVLEDGKVRTVSVNSKNEISTEEISEDQLREKFSAEIKPVVIIVTDGTDAEEAQSRIKALAAQLPDVKMLNGKIREAVMTESLTGPLAERLMDMIPSIVITERIKPTFTYKGFEEEELRRIEGEATENGERFIASRQSQLDYLAQLTGSENETEGGIVYVNGWLSEGVSEGLYSLARTAESVADKNEAIKGARFYQIRGMEYMTASYDADQNGRIDASEENNIFMSANTLILTAQDIAQYLKDPEIVNNADLKE
ncbi:MAG TPA: hypothetical protein PKV41_04415, partial [Candidatus Omnitrophota bacterium]|nr:hypothetical protein [Candidatus Omnitrophota bacterium]